MTIDVVLNKLRYQQHSIWETWSAMSDPAASTLVNFFNFEKCNVH